ncbi:unnamed protein product [Linum tenue]|uniref:Uncharacterized protein n=1 Tax=Linum tenue TaxID=586396 RepID=A0AAV0K3E6_9ROSI|nr:unnamed protein product [Linum tenue]
MAEEGPSQRLTRRRREPPRRRPCRAPGRLGRAAGDSSSGRLTSTIRSLGASWRMPRRSSVSPTPARCGSPARRWSSRRF